MPDTTPKLTVIPLELTAAELAPIRAKAFEEAAAIRVTPPRLTAPEVPPMGRYLTGWDEAVAAYVVAIRALAKEQTGG